MLACCNNFFTILSHCFRLDAAHGGFCLMCFSFSRADVVHAPCLGGLPLGVAYKVMVLARHPVRGGLKAGRLGLCSVLLWVPVKGLENK